MARGAGRGRGRARPQLSEDSRSSRAISKRISPAEPTARRLSPLRAALLTSSPLRCRRVPPPPSSREGRFRIPNRNWDAGREEEVFAQLLRTSCLFFPQPISGRPEGTTFSCANRRRCQVLGHALPLLLPENPSAF